MRIDTSNIENYESMTAEEKIAALEEYDVKDTETEKRYKEIISKANTEAKRYKDAMKLAEEKLKGQMTEDERVKAETEEKYKSIAEENAKLKREMSISQKTAHYRAMGYSEELAQQTAEAFVDGDYQTVEANEIKAHEEFEKTLRADVVRQTPGLHNGGANEPTITLAEAMKRANDGEDVSALMANIKK